MICPKCNGKGEAIYYVETDRDENSVTVEQRKGTCRTCNGSGEKPQTNADRIRAMTDEELADWLCWFVLATLDASDIPNDGFADGEKELVLKGLQQTAEGE